MIKKITHIALISTIAFQTTLAQEKDKHVQLKISKASTAPIIDGVADDSAWKDSNWQAINQTILGTPPEKDDFNGRYKVAWTKDKLFILAEITDDILADRHSHPLDSYWNDDTFEILIDEDNSGGNHQDNYNAFAYHIALDNQAVDIDTSGKPRLLNDHVKSIWKRSTNKPSTIIWEVSIDIYSDQFKDHYNDNEAHIKPSKLSSGKKMGLMIAYCDNDGGDERENFITSYDINAVDGDKNRAYIDASVFQPIILIE